MINNLIDEPFDKVTALLDLDGEKSFSSWYSSTQFFCIFLLWFFFCYKKLVDNRKSYPLFLLPLIFLLMSIDESVQIHEWLGVRSDALIDGGTRAGSSFPITGIWMFIIGLPFLILFLMFTHSIRHHFIDKLSSFKLMVAGMIIMLSGALGMEVLSNYVENQLLVVAVIVEEGLEMAGATVMLWAAYNMLQEYIPHADENGGGR